MEIRFKLSNPHQFNKPKVVAKIIAEVVISGHKDIAPPEKGSRTGSVLIRLGQANDWWIDMLNDEVDVIYRYDLPPKLKAAIKQVILWRLGT